MVIKQNGRLDYNRYTDIFDYEDVPEEERREVAKSVAHWVLNSLAHPSESCASSCAVNHHESAACCG